ncbi:SpaH/EbpB family LPXTG-anchored major pilin [uncultured Faecalibaculum sp.]|nr:SpaH/EbpB family LPXTG-anchored major pilin [uncultured Faecalibaculum sp.]
MKHTFKKLFSVLAAFMMVVGLGLTTVKAEETGTITVENAQQNTTYTLYKVLDIESSGAAVSYYTQEKTVADAFANAKVGEKSLFVVNGPDGQSRYNVSIADGVTDPEALAWIKTNIATGSVGTNVAEKITEDGQTTVVFNKIASGYYYVTTSNGSVVTITNADNTVRIEDKNEHEPTVPDDGLKQLVGENGKVTSSAQIGDTKNYKIAFTATNYTGSGDDLTQITKYVVTDTPTGIAYNNDFAVKVGNTTLTKVQGTATEKGTYSMSTDAETGAVTFTIPWGKAAVAATGDTEGKPAESFYASPSDVKITYSATVTTEDVAVKNHASLVVNSGEPIKGNDVTIDTARIQIKKYITGTEEFLADAEFKLMKGNDEVKLLQDEDGTYYVAPAVKNGEETPEYATLKSNATAALVVRGLDPKASYTIQETKAPAGYKLDPEVKNVEFTAGDANTVRFTLSVYNEAGSSLPSTGGMGTTVLYTIGGALVVGAAIILITKKRMAA